MAIPTPTLGRNTFRTFLARDREREQERRRDSQDNTGPRSTDGTQSTDAPTDTNDMVSATQAANDQAMQAAMDAGKPFQEASEADRQNQARAETMGGRRVRKMIGSYRDADGVKRNSRTSEAIEDRGDKPGAGLTPAGRLTPSSGVKAAAESRLNRDAQVGFRGAEPVAQTGGARQMPNSNTLRGAEGSDNALTTRTGKSVITDGTVKFVEGKYGTAMGRTGTEIRRGVAMAPSPDVANIPQAPVAPRPVDNSMQDALAKGAAMPMPMPTTPIIPPATPSMMAGSPQIAPSATPPAMQPQIAGSTQFTNPSPGTRVATATPPRPKTREQLNRENLAKGDAMAANFDPNKIAADAGRGIAGAVSTGVKALAAVTARPQTNSMDVSKVPQTLNNIRTTPLIGRRETTPTPRPRPVQQTAVTPKPSTQGASKPTKPLYANR